MSEIFLSFLRNVRIHLILPSHLLSAPFRTAHWFFENNDEVTTTGSITTTSSSSQGSFISYFQFKRNFLARIPELSTNWEDIGVSDRPGWHGENLGPPDETRSTTTTPETTLENTYQLYSINYTDLPIGYRNDCDSSVKTTLVIINDTKQMNNVNMQNDGRVVELEFLKVLASDNFDLDRLKIAIFLLQY